MDLRTTFDEDAANYDRWRPRYCPELFEEILRYGRLRSGDRAIEMGCGTGQATRPFLQAGIRVTAVELGQSLAAYARAKFVGYDGFSIAQQPFEEFPLPDAPADLLYAATAFHWIPEDIAYPKAMALLRPGGTLALFWNRPFPAHRDDAMQSDIQAAYARMIHRGARPSKVLQADQSDLFAQREETIRRYGFVEQEMHVYTQTRIFRPEEHTKLLNTYSDHIAMKTADRLELEKEIEQAIHRHGGILTIEDTIDLHLACKLQ